MGLAGRKDKQRIGSDPRNLSWADDASKFGQAYLSKMGWDPSKGLGISGEGRTSHIKVAQKLNLMGVGAGAQQGPDGIAWKQNKDYELLLARLNDAQAETVDVSFDDAEQPLTQDDSEKKRKREESGSEPTDTDERQRRKREKKEKKALEKEEKRKRKEERKRRREGRGGIGPSVVAEVEATTSTSTEEVASPRLMVNRSHRARFLKSKRLAAVSSAAMAEILGVSGSSTPLSRPESGSSTPMLSSSSTPISASIPDSMQELTTSTKSVADYFKDKLAQRSRSGSAPVVQTELPVAIEEEEAPRLGLGLRRVRFEDEDLSGPHPRLSSFAGPSFVSSTSAPLTSTEVQENINEVVSDAQAEPPKTHKTKKRKKSHSPDAEMAVETSEYGSSSTDLLVVAEKKKKEKKSKSKKHRDS